MPKLFISYSWTSPEYEEEVLRFATVLREEHGIDVQLDKWHLKEGQDAYAFMERMVTDEEIQKVILLCNRAYMEKANKRLGGVGAETQIVSSELYEKTDQTKFVAVVMERTEDGKFPVPAYYKGRIHIDLSDPITYDKEFDRLLRWVFDKPLHVEPPLGQPPAFLRESYHQISLGTASRFRRAVGAIEGDLTTADGAVSEYFDCLVTEMGKLEMLDPPPGEIDDAVVDAIEAFTPYRNEAIRIIDLLAQYRDRVASWRMAHRFFENLLPYLDELAGSGRVPTCNRDALKFVIHELLLHAIAILLRRERFDFAGYLLNTEFYDHTAGNRGNEVMVSYSAFRKSIESLNERNKRLELRKISLQADMLINRADGHPQPSIEIIQADFVMYIRDLIHCQESWSAWWPTTLLYAKQRAQPFEIFARAKSTDYFNRMRSVLGIKTRDGMQEMVNHLNSPGQGRLQWQHVSVPVLWYLGFDQMCSRP